MIGYAAQEGRMVQVYDLDHRRLFQKIGELISFTTESVIIRDHDSDHCNIWNAKGKSLKQIKIKRNQSYQKTTYQDNSSNDDEGCAILLGCVGIGIILAILGIFIH